MIPAFIVLLVIAFALGGYIAFDILNEKKKAAVVDTGNVAENAAEDIIKDVAPFDEQAEAATDVSETEDAPTVAIANDEAEIAEADDGKDDEVTQIKPVAENGKTRYIVIKYSKSFLAKLIQSDDEVKRYYSDVKNRLLSYDGVKSRTTWKCEAFRKGRKTLARLRFRGKVLSLCFAGNADVYAGTKYHVESLAPVKAYAATPCMYRIKNDRRLKYAEELIAAFMEQNEIAEKPIEKADYAAMYPYEATEALIERKLVKVLTDKDAQSGTAFKPSEVREKVTASEVDTLMKDEVAESLIEKAEGETDKTKQAIINIDTLSQHFESGEVVTLDEIKKRVKGINKNTTYIKVLARGMLDKALTVEADSFSLQAVKMIVLTGGKAVKKQ